MCNYHFIKCNYRFNCRFLCFFFGYSIKSCRFTDAIKNMASMDMEERYRLIISTILNAIGCRVEVERMLSTGRIDILAQTQKFIYVMELKLSKNGGRKAGAEQIIRNQYLEPFKGRKQQAIGLSIELDDLGKGLVDWEEVKE